MQGEIVNDIKDVAVSLYYVALYVVNSCISLYGNLFCGSLNLQLQLADLVTTLKLNKLRIDCLLFVLQNISFPSPFYTPPVILTTAINGGSNDTKKVCAKKGPLTSWLEVTCINLYNN